jgi:hypothetical protein
VRALLEASEAPTRPQSATTEEGVHVAPWLLSARFRAAPAVGVTYMELRQRGAFSVQWGSVLSMCQEPLKSIFLGAIRRLAPAWRAWLPTRMIHAHGRGCVIAR